MLHHISYCSRLKLTSEYIVALVIVHKSIMEPSSSHNTKHKRKHKLQDQKHGVLSRTKNIVCYMLCEYIEGRQRRHWIPNRDRIELI